MSKTRNPDALIRIEDAIKVLCRKYCCPGPLCPDGYCVEMWDEFEDVERVDAVPVDDVLALATALSKRIEVLELPTRVYNALSRSAYYTVADVYRLWKSGNLKKAWNLGDKSIGVIEDRLCAYLPYLWRMEGRTDGTAEETEKTV